MALKKFIHYFPLASTAYLLLFFSFLQMDLLNSFGEGLMAELNLSHSQFGLLASLYFYVNMLLLIPAGICLDRYGSKLTICVALLCTLFGLSIFVLHPTFTTAIFWRCSSGVLGAVSVIGPLMLIAKTFERRQMGRTIGGFGLIIMSAGIIAQTPVMLIIQHLGMRTTLLIDILFGIAVFFVILFAAGVHHRKDTSLRQEYEMIKQVYLNRVNLRIVCFASLINLPIFILGAGWGNLFLRTERSIAAAEAASILSMVFIGNIVGALLFGYISDFFRNRLFLMLAGSVVYTISLIGFVPGVAVNMSLLYIIVFFIGFATGSQTLSYALMIDLHRPTLQGKAASMVSLFSVGFGATMQMVCGYIDIHHVSMILIFCAAASIALSVFSNLTAKQISRDTAQVHE